MIFASDSLNACADAQWHSRFKLRTFAGANSTPTRIQVATIRRTGQTTVVLADSLGQVPVLEASLQYVTTQYAVELCMTQGIRDVTSVDWWVIPLHAAKSGCAQRVRARRFPSGYVLLQRSTWEPLEALFSDAA